ncbi:MAG: thioredoxin domain-containing protein [bacterium]
MPNRLAHAVSPYLLQHADDPVAWRQWNSESLTEARERDVPIFLSIGYSTCRWCHVMARETFADAAIAERLNMSFVAIKVDREERPDLDRIYMAYVQAVTGRGGWPLSVWLTPTLKPFFGGTYFPPEDRGDQPGFSRVLASISEGWARDRIQVEAESNRILENLRGAKLIEPIGHAEPDLTEPGGEAFEQAFTYFFENHDAQAGGFGGAPKFPRPQVIEFLLRCAALQGLESDSGREAMQMIRQSLVGMARGGVHDHVGGGFHRYAVDDEWRLPHFEKMLYDQAQIAGNLIETYHFTADERFAGLAAHLFSYVERDLRHPDGGFFAAEDAESPDQKEGAFYLWSRDELAAVAGDQFDWFSCLFDIQAAGNIPAKLDPQGALRKLNVLHQKEALPDVAKAFGRSPEDLAKRLQDLLQHLRRQRGMRPRPHRDEKIVTAWNGLMIASLARASVCTAESLQGSIAHYRDLATAAADFIRAELWNSDDRILHRFWRDGARSGPGFAEDYAAMIHGLLELHDATLNSEWLGWADELQSAMDHQFWDDSGGGYFQARLEDPSIVLHLKDDYDGAEPSASSLAAANLFRLAALLHDEGRYRRAMQSIQAFRHVWSRTPWAVPVMLGAIEWALAKPVQVVLSGDSSDPEYREMVAIARDRRGPRRVTKQRQGPGQSSRNGDLSGGPAQAHICTASECAAPTFSASDLREALNP